jgi:hypothetical protein
MPEQTAAGGNEQEKLFDLVFEGGGAKSIDQVGAYYSSRSKITDL